jgi:eukaryotic-like serine/threonine-protein kinase
VREEPQPPSNFDAEITPEMDAIVLKALVKDPDYRYQSADEMRADIEACLDGQPVAATAMMGSVGYGTGYAGYADGAPTTALPQQDGGQTSMLPPMRDDDGGYGYDERPARRRQNPKKSNTSTILLVVAGILVLIGAIFLGQALFSGDGGNDSVELPNFVGVTKARAEAMATNGNVSINWGTPVFCDDQAKSLVCKQTPAFSPDTQINKDEKVTLFLSKGKQRVQVPDVTGQSQGDATQTLQNSGFQVDTKTQETASAAEGTVLSQDPAGGKTAAKGSTVTITVAKKPTTIQLPNVVGQNVTNAENILKQAGFTNITTQQEPSAQPQNTVTKQSPDPFNEYAADTQITLTVSSGVSATTVPNVVGQTVKDARKILQNSGFTNIQFAGGSSSDDSARVAAQDPPANTPESDPGSVPITLTTIGGNNGGGFFGGGNG